MSEINNKKTVSLETIRNQVAETYLKSLRLGHGWFAVRVNPQGEVYETLEASPCYSGAEYFDRRPHTVTIWDRQANYQALDEDELEGEREAMDDQWFDTNLPRAELEAELAKAGLTLEDDV